MPPSGRLILGLEHEFGVRRARAVVDFRSVVHDLALGQPNLDPADPNAYRLASGAALTADGGEAEIALPPTPVVPGFATRAAQGAFTEHVGLSRALGSDYALTGCSTHLSVSIPTALASPVAGLYAATFAAAMMLLLDRPSSPGLLVRPRPGRLELGGEYATGDQLVAASAFAVGSVLAAVRAVRGRARARVPEHATVRMEPAVARYGWYVDRTAFGGDLYATGRRTMLTTRGGTRISAQAHLERCWDIARNELRGLAAPDELRLVDDEVAGRRRIPLEWAPGEPLPPSVTRAAPARSPFGSAVQSRSRPEFGIAPVMLTWDLAVFLALGVRGRRRAFVAVPGQDLGWFLPELDAGAYDRQIGDALRRRPRRRLESLTQVNRVAIYGEVGPRSSLLAPEFDRNGRWPGVERRAAGARRDWVAWRRRIGIPRGRGLASA